MKYGMRRLVAALLLICTLCSFVVPATFADNTEDIIFVKDDIVINEVELKDIDSYMQALTDAENHCFHYLLIHEQYFYPHYFNYEPDYRERIFAAVDFCHRNGYRPATLTSVALE